jgi:hypothetical protein
MPFSFYYDEGDLFTIILWSILVVAAIFFNLYMKYWWYKNRDTMKDFVSKLTPNNFST